MAPDFKRLKAKVGKRAPKPANYTDTSFRAVSVAVPTQTAVERRRTVDQDQPTSRRGKTLPELLSLLKHAAPNARLSAAKGLLDWIQQCDLIEPHVSLLLPGAAAACLDADADVRDMARASLERILQRTSVTVHTPLLVAYTSSALYSLDRSIRFDGARLVHLLVSHDIFIEDVKILPALVRLVGEQSPFVALKEGSSRSNKRKRSASTSLVALQALESYLHASIRRAATSKQQAEGLETPDVSLSVARSHPILLPGRPLSSQPLATITSIQDLAAAEEDASTMAQAPCLEVLQAFRNALVDASQQSPGKRLPPALVEPYRLLVRCIRFFYQSNRLPKNVQKLSLQVGRLLVQNFPLVNQDALNAQIALAILAVSQCHEQPDDWMQAVALFAQETLSNTDDDTLSATILRIYERLMEQEPACVPTVLSALIPILQDASSKANVSRGSVRLVHAMRHALNLEDPAYRNILETLPALLDAWASNYPSDSGRAVTLLVDWVRRMPRVDTLNEHIRNSLAPLVASRPDGSTFELYPEPLQRRILSLLVYLTNPDPVTRTQLAKTCARSRHQMPHAVSRQVADATVDSMHLIRRSMPMQAYLSFLMDATGLTTTPSTEKSGLSSLDHGLRQACRCLADCGSLKVLPMLQPLLCKWLDAHQAVPMSEQLCQRAGIAMVAMLSLDAGFLTDDLESKLPHAIVELFSHAPSGSGEEYSSGLEVWIRPAVALLGSKPNLLAHVFERAANSNNNCAAEETITVRLLECLLFVLREPRVCRIVLEVSGARLIKPIKSLSASKGLNSESKALVGSIVGRLSTINKTHDRRIDRSRPDRQR